MLKLFKLIERNMRRNLARTILTMLTIALATFIYTILICVPASMDKVVNDASGTLRLIINNKTAPWQDLPARYCDDIIKMPGAAACVGITGWFATWRSPSEPVFCAAAGPEISAVFPDYEMTDEQRIATRKERRSAIVGEVLMRKYGWKIGQQVTLRGTDADHMEMTFIIMGLMKSKRYPNTFLIRRDYLMEARKAHGGYDEDIAWNIIVRADSAEALAPLAKQIDERFANSDYETRTSTESDALASGLSALGNVRGIIFALCAVVILTVLLIAANSTAMMVRDRIGEVAIMRALGFPRSSVASLLFGECAILGLAGGLLGAIPALWMFSGGVTLGAVLSGNGALWVTPRQALSAVIAALLVSIGSGLIPIAAAIRIPPAMAFRKVV
ncbi:MAG: ABC transporter permease [Candidatus Binatus sp.]|uniref:ABC transporter permease n=1 Tax=Candidatus Binatus sp. TaxID=2811406 RepID=UPI00271D947D|nr:ABC transporter permease [Candidatus Binatus sp.]MDO8432547.1 ABC transporter permease [Candidatus Binatus sp.]